MNKPVFEENIRETPLSEALSDRYLSYAMSTIVSRSLPDVRDGLKPVHRRLLYAMRELKLDPNSGFKKCARVVGDVIGKYHPHGDSAVYDAMVRLAQDFAVRYPLVEGQGNFGNIDGDNAAAMRYTEARLTQVAWHLMEGLSQDAVDFRETYDGEESEPIVMPGAFPNLLANGSSGIAVGMATNIPPHNLSELCDGLLKIIKNPDITISQLVNSIKGPDFPTGGTLVEDKRAIINAYETGRGAFRVRAKWEKEELPRGAYQIIITQIPYQVQKAKLIEKIADLLLSKKLPLLSDIRDESAEEIRIVLEPKNRSVAPEHIMEHLFKQTDLESRFNLNMNVLSSKGVPGVMNLKEVLEEFLNHRIEVLIRTNEFRLEKIIRRLEILEGYLIAFLNLDEIIRIVREEDEPKAIMMKSFDLTENQADAILNMKLRSLRKLEEVQIKEEHKTLSEEKNDIEKLLGSQDLRWEKISKEIEETKSLFNKKTKLGKRKTEIGEAPNEVVVPIEAMIEKEPITVIVSKMGWVRAMKGHVNLSDDFKFKDNDELKFALHAQTTDKILFFSTEGRFFTLSGSDLPAGRGFGQPLRLLVDLPSEANIAHVFVHQKDAKLLVASDTGRGFVVEENSVVAQTKNGKKILNLTDKETAKICKRVEGNAIAIIGDNRRLLIYDISEIPVMTRGRGVILQRYRSGGLSDVKIFDKESGLEYPSGNGKRVETDLLPWLGKRAQAGRLPPVGFPRNNMFTR